MRSYNTLNSRILNTSLKNSNTLANVFQTNYLGKNGNPPSVNNNTSENDNTTGNADLSSYALKTYVDGSLNNIYTNYALISGVYTKSAVDASFALKTYVDGSLNNIYTNYALISGVYTKSAVDASFALKTYVDSSLNTNYYTRSVIDSSINTNYYSKSAVDASFALNTYVDSSLNNIRTQLNTLTSGAPQALDTLAEIVTAINSDASFGIVVYQKIASSDLSINELRIKNGIQDTSINLLTTSNLIQDPSISVLITSNGIQDTSINLLTTSNLIQDTSINLLTTYNSTQDTSINLLTTYNSTQDTSINRIYNLDVSLNGNIRLGSGNKSIAINKDISTNFALDISGSTNIVGNLSVTKNPSDISYSYFDLSSVNLSIFNTIEKFTTVTYNTTSMTLNYSLGSIFYTSASGANFGALVITNVPTTLNRAITVTLITAQSGTFYFTGTAVSVNGTSITYIKQDGTAFAAPSASRTMIVYQFNIIFASATPTIIGTMTGFS